MTISKAQIALFATFIASAAFTIDMVLPALPSLAADLHIDISAAGAMLSVFFISFAVGQLIAGPISDRIGRRPLVLWGLVLLLASSAVAVFTTSFEVLVAMRILQALGICSLTVNARASVADMLGAQDSAKVFALLMLVGGVAPMVAPWLGTMVDRFFGWRGVFVTIIVLASVLLVFSYFKLPETHRRSRDFKENTLVSYWKLVTNPRVLMYTLAGAFSGGVLFTFLGGVSPLLREVYQVQQSQFAAIFTLHAVMLVTGGQISRTVLKYKKPQDALLISAGIMAGLGIVMIIAGIVLNAPLIGLLIVQYLIALNFATIQANGLALAISGDENRAGAGAALFGAAGFAMGSLMSTIANALFDGTNVPYVLISAANVVGILVCTWYGNKLRAREEQLQPA